jgi:hypothetical protein
MAPGRSKILQVSMAAGGSQQAIDQVDSMEIDDLGPWFELSPVRIPIPRIAYFLCQRLHVDTQSPKVWCRTDNVGQIRDMLLIEVQENIENRPEDILLHIRDLTDSPPTESTFGRL